MKIYNMKYPHTHTRTRTHTHTRQQQQQQPTIKHNQQVLVHLLEMLRWVDLQEKISVCQMAMFLLLLTTMY